MKYTKNLKHLSFMRLGFLRDYDVKGSYDNLFWKAMKRNRLEVLELEAKNDFRFLNSLELKLANAPNTLKELSLKYALQKVVCFIERIPEIFRRSLKNLKSLSLSLPPDSELWECLLTSIPKPKSISKINHWYSPRNRPRFHFILSYFTRKQPSENSRTHVYGSS